MNFPLELNQSMTIPITIKTNTPNAISMNHPGLSINQPQALPGKPRNSRKFQSLPHLELLDPRLPSANPAKKAVNPTTNHLCRSKGWKRATFIRFHARPKGAKKAILSIFLPPRILSFPYLPHIYYAKTVRKIRSSGIYIIFSLLNHSLNPTVNSKTIKVLLKSGKLMRR